MVLPPPSPSPSPGDFCVGLGVLQTSKETTRKVKFNKLLSLSLLDLYWDLLCLARCPEYFCTVLAFKLFLFLVLS